MERRSRRGRPSFAERYEPEPTPGPSTGRGRASGKGTATATSSKVIEAAVATITPQPAAPEEVVLNARGMPARQRKKNRYYYDEEVMITPDTMAKSKSYTKRIKAEPVDTEEEEEVDSFTHSYSTTPPQRGSAIVHEQAGPSTSRAAQSPYTPVVAKPKGRPRRSETVTVDDTAKAVSPERADKGRSPGTPKGVRGRGKKFMGEEQQRKEKPEKSKKQKEVPRPSPVEPPKKPKMQFIRIKREPDMSLGAPQHVIQTEYTTETNYRQRERQVSERDRRDPEGRKGYGHGQFDDRMIKHDYLDPLTSSAAARGHYAYDEYGVVSSKASKPDPLERGGLDKKTAHDISIRLRNLLKLPKAHKWVCYEWFYSNIDKVLFEGENDFQICLKESFPQLKVRKMARVEWCKVRRLMGKPRRCSQSFFDEEREELMRRRQKIRMIQQRKVTDFNYKELPDEIPLQLVIGTKVTSRLRKPQDGLFTGTIDGVDTSNNTYRITFDRPGLGTHSIPDYEVLSNEAPETVSTSSFAMKIPRRNYGAFSSGTFKFQNPLLMGEEIEGFPKSPFPVDGMLGGFPIRLLDMIVRLSKLLKGKREKILQLKELNVEAEKLRSYGKSFNDDYHIRYARVVVDLESMNKEMGMYLEGIQQYCLEIAPDHGANQMIIPEHVQESCRQEAVLLVDTYNTNKNRNMVHGNKTLQLIADMTSLLLQVKALSAGDRNLYELKSIKDTLSEIKASLGGKNVQIFQDRVEIPMNRVQTGLTLPAHK